MRSEDDITRSAELAVVDAAADLLKQMARLQTNLLRITQLAAPGAVAKAHSALAVDRARLRIARDAVVLARDALHELLPDEGTEKGAPSSRLGAALRQTLEKLASESMKPEKGAIQKEPRMKKTDQGTGLGAELKARLHQADLRKRQDAETLRKTTPASAPATTAAAKAATP